MVPIPTNPELREAAMTELAMNYDIEPWCYEHMVDKLECVFCTFGENNLLFMHICERCARGPGHPRTWGWRSPDGPFLCVRCMGLGGYQDIATHELRIDPTVEWARLRGD
jgi:hypothetical protein